MSHSNIQALCVFASWDGFYKHEETHPQRGLMTKADSGLFSTIIIWMGKCDTHLFQDYCPLLAKKEKRKEAIRETTEGERHAQSQEPKTWESTPPNRRTHPSSVQSLMKVLMLPITQKSTISTVSGGINKDHRKQTVLIQTETEGQDFEIESVYWLSDVFSWFAWEGLI